MATIILAILVCSLPLLKASSEDFKQIIENADYFYNDLMKKYDATEFNDSIKQSIDYKIDLFHQTTSKQFQVLQTKNEFFKTKTHKKGLEVFKNFEKYLNLNLSKVEDVIFFKKYIGYEQWFGITLTSETFTVYTITEDKLELVGRPYPMKNATRLQAIKLSKGIFIVIEKPTEIIILDFFPQDKNYLIQEIQSLNFTDVTHSSHWTDNDQIFLGVSTSEKINIYIWQEKSFELLQTLPLSSKLFISCRIEDSRFLVALGNRKTTILEYETGQFYVSQIINKGFIDAEVVNLKGNRNFLSLVSASRTVVYELSEDENIFKPFQEISSADRIVSTIRDDTALLMLIKDHVLNVYQFDGSRFAKLDYEMKEVEKIKIVNLRNLEVALVKKDLGTWSLSRLIWEMEETNAHRYRDIRQWCLDAMEKFKGVPEIYDPDEILNRQNIKIKVKRVNDISIEKLQNLKDRYNQLNHRIKIANESLSQVPTIENPQFSNLQARTVRAKCARNCSVKSLITKLSCDILSNTRRVDDSNRTLKFEHVKVDKLDGFVCPMAGIKVKEVNVSGLINGISFKDFHENVLRTSGDQTITGEHIFENVKVSSIVAPNIDVASTKTRQRIKATEIHADELILPEAGLLLPLDGEAVTMTGTLTVSRAKFNGPVHLHGGLRGKSIKRFVPMVHFPDVHELSGNYTLNNVRVAENLIAQDVRRTSGSSIREIKEEAIPLTDGVVPVRLMLKSNIIVWKNVSMDNLPKWLTRKNSNMVDVTGKKIAAKDVTMPRSLYSNLPIPKLRAHVCSVSAAVSNVKTSTLKVGEAKAKSVQSDNVDGANDLHSKIHDSVTTLDEADLSRKSFTGLVRVENLTISNFENSPFWSFNNAKFIWSHPNYIKGPLEVQNLKIRSLNAAAGIKVPCPLTVENMIVEGNLQVQKINGINFNELFNDIVRTNETVYMKKIIFDYLEVNEIQAADSNIDLQEFDATIHLGNKEISGTLEIEEDLSIPNLLTFPSENEVNTYVVEGSIAFETEPLVSSFNGKNLRELLSGIWLLDRPGILMGNYVLKNVTFTDFSAPFESLQTPNFGFWKSLESRILSKVNLQEIEVPAYFKNVKVPNIIARQNSNLRSFDPYLNELFFGTLKNNESQIIKEQWEIEELIILDKILVEREVNKLNLTTDVARYDVDVNVVRGKKTVNYLTLRNLMGLNFEKWSEDVFLPSDSARPTRIKGRKVFDAFSSRLLTVSGTIMGKKMEECLQQYGDQIITSPKIIKGSLHAPAVTVNGLVNDVNLTEHMNYELKKQEPLQSIKSVTVFKNDLQIFGNLTIQEKLEEIDLEKLDSMYEFFIPPVRAVEYLKPFAMKIGNVTTRPARYWNKFEEIPENSSLVSNETKFANHASFVNLGNCTLLTFTEINCVTGGRFFLKTFRNSAEEVLLNRILSLKNVPVVVQVTSGQNGRITIFTYSNSTRSFELETVVRAPGITKASLSTLNDVVWIAAQLKSHMMVVSYKSRSNLQKYHLPAASFFALDRATLTNELVLIRDDGMWKLNGLEGPRHEIKVFMEAEKVETIAAPSGQFYVRLTCKDGNTKLLKARYVGV